MVIGAALGANTRPVDQDLGVAFIAALIATARGAAIGAIIILSLRSMSFVLVGAGIGLMVSLFLSGGLRLLNQMVLTRPVSDLQITLVVLFGTFISFAILSGRR
jgi:hypothetical protein